jgi:Cu+-exporting ATPase
MKRRHIFIILIAAVTLLVFLAGCGQQQEESAQMKEPTGQEESMSSDEPAREAEIMHARAVDPACGMEVDPEMALAAEYHGHMYYFCSAQCRDQFLEDPGKYLSEEHMTGDEHLEGDHTKKGEEHHMEEGLH